MIDARKDYGEVRYRSYGLIDGQPYCLVFTRLGDDTRAISLRRSRAKELRRFAELGFEGAQSERG